MRISFRGKVLLAGALSMTTLAAWGQAAPAAQTHNLGEAFDVALTYDYTQGNAVTTKSFSMQGGSAQVHDQIWRGLGLVGDVGGAHSVNVANPKVGLDLVTLTAGPRYTWKPLHHGFSFYGQALGGGAFGMNSVFPTLTGTITSAHAVAVKVGTGMNVPVTPRISVRAFEVDWLYTQLPNGTTDVQNNLRVGAGIVFHLP
jgi:hypothetical protein